MRGLLSAFLFSDLDHPEEVSFGVNLRYVGAGVPQHDLSGFETVLRADLGCVEVPELVRRPSWDSGGAT